MKILSALLFSLLISKNLIAASCCGGGSAAPSIITGDYKSQLTTSFGHSSIVAYSQSEGYFRSEGRDRTQSVNFSYAYNFENRWQAFTNASFLQRNIEKSEENESASSLGDASLGTSYEFLPELTYSRWKPRGFVYFKYNQALANSKYAYNNKLGSDALGEGLNGLTLGFLFTKIFTRFDYLLSFDYTYRLDRVLDDTTIKPGDKNSTFVSLGYSPRGGDWRFGVGFSQTYFQKVALQKDDFSSRTTHAYFSESLLSLSYLLDSENMYAIIYKDQTLIGPARHMPLERSLSVTYQKRFSL